MNRFVALLEFIMCLCVICADGGEQCESEVVKNRRVQRKFFRGRQTIAKAQGDIDRENAENTLFQRLAEELNDRTSRVQEGSSRAR